MSIERYLRLIAGSFVLASLLLGYFHSPYWFLFTGFVGLNLIQSAFTNWCLMISFLRWLGARSDATPLARSSEA
ncbi:MAG: YgaP family membrane protein [Pyrinomonadaceae bacterium]